MDLTFAIEALADFRTVGAVAPSSRHLANAMLGPLPLKRARTVVEVGPGTGVITRALLNRLPFDATLLAFEINPRFSRHLRTTVPDTRLTLLDASAEKLRGELERRGYRHVDAVVSSLALGLMPQSQRHELLTGVCALLSEKGAFTQYQYVHSMQVMTNGHLKRFDLEEMLRRYFRSVQRKMIWRNLPPAFVFVCKGPRKPEAAATAEGMELDRC
jgi:phosphatidylethanolamine/phosphatidyl-N-methylethanolamine N-methyltransferase